MKKTVPPPKRFERSPSVGSDEITESRNATDARTTM